MKRNRYRVYDHHRGEWWPGEYESKELSEKTGINTKWSVYAENGSLVNKRYRIKFAEEGRPQTKFPPEILAEWDRTRLKILEG